MAAFDAGGDVSLEGLTVTDFTSEVSVDGGWIRRLGDDGGVESGVFSFDKIFSLATRALRIGVVFAGDVEANSFRGVVLLRGVTLLVGPGI